MAGTKKDPAFLFYCTTWLQSREVNTMSLEQQGAYVRLLCFAWLHGSIPDDLEELRLMLGLGGDETAFDRIWSKMSRRWSKVPGTPGQLINMRQEAERVERKQKAEEMRTRGQAGGQRSAEQRSSGIRAGPQAEGQAEGQAETKPSTTTTTTLDNQRAKVGSCPSTEGVPEPSPRNVGALIDGVANARRSLA